MFGMDKAFLMRLLIFVNLCAIVFGNDSRENRRCQDCDRRSEEVPVDSREHHSREDRPPDDRDYEDDPEDDRSGPEDRRDDNDVEHVDASKERNDSRERRPSEDSIDERSLEEPPRQSSRESSEHTPMNERDIYDPPAPPPFSRTSHEEPYEQSDPPRSNYGGYRKYGETKPQTETGMKNINNAKKPYDRKPTRSRPNPLPRPKFSDRLQKSKDSTNRGANFKNTAKFGEPLRNAIDKAREDVKKNAIRSRENKQQDMRDIQRFKRNTRAADVIPIYESFLPHNGKPGLTTFTEARTPRREKKPPVRQESDSRENDRSDENSAEDDDEDGEEDSRESQERPKVNARVPEDPPRRHAPPARKYTPPPRQHQRHHRVSYVTTYRPAIRPPLPATRSKVRTTRPSIVRGTPIDDTVSPLPPPRSTAPRPHQKVEVRKNTPEKQRSSKVITTKKPARKIRPWKWQETPKDFLEFGARLNQERRPTDQNRWRETSTEVPVVDHDGGGVKKVRRKKKIERLAVPRIRKPALKGKVGLEDPTDPKGGLNPEAESSISRSSFRIFDDAHHIDNSSRQHDDSHTPPHMQEKKADAGSDSQSEESKEQTDERSQESAAGVTPMSFTTFSPATFGIPLGTGQGSIQQNLAWLENMVQGRFIPPDDTKDDTKAELTSSFKPLTTSSTSSLDNFDSDPINKVDITSDEFWSTWRPPEDIRKEWETVTNTPRNMSTDQKEPSEESRDRAAFRRNDEDQDGKINHGTEWRKIEGPDKVTVTEPVKNGAQQSTRQHNRYVGVFKFKDEKTPFGMPRRSLRMKSANKLKSLSTIPDHHNHRMRRENASSNVTKAFEKWRHPAHHKHGSSNMSHVARKAAILAVVLKPGDELMRNVHEAISHLSSSLNMTVVQLPQITTPVPNSHRSSKASNNNKLTNQMQLLKEDKKRFGKNNRTPASRRNRQSLERRLTKYDKGNIRLDVSSSQTHNVVDKSKHPTATSGRRLSTKNGNVRKEDIPVLKSIPLPPAQKRKRSERRMGDDLEAAASSHDRGGEKKHEEFNKNYDRVKHNLVNDLKDMNRDNTYMPSEYIISVKYKNTTNKEAEKRLKSRGFTETHHRLVERFEIIHQHEDSEEQTGTEEPKDPDIAAAEESKDHRMQQMVDDNLRNERNGEDIHKDQMERPPIEVKTLLHGYKGITPYEKVYRGHHDESVHDFPSKGFPINEGFKQWVNKVEV